jgi:hypothetical protein
MPETGVPIVKAHAQPTYHFGRKILSSNGGATCDRLAVSNLMCPTPFTSRESFGPHADTRGLVCAPDYWT